jgi:hypothetical protein
MVSKEKLFDFGESNLIEEGEDWLHEEYACFPGDDRKLIIGADCGSTQTRISVITEEDIKNDTILDSAGKYYIIPSEFKEITTSFVNPTDKTLWGNMCSVIAKSTLKPEEELVRKHKILRGDLANSIYGIMGNRIDATRSKIDFPDLYLNIIDSIGYMAVAKFSSCFPATIRCKLGVALPPGDVSSDTTLSRFRDRLCGTYSWSCIGRKLEIIIEDVMSQSEPLAQIAACFALGEIGPIPSYRLVVEAGGRSTGLVIVGPNNRALEGMSRTIPDGGLKLHKIFSDIYYSDSGIMPSVEASEMAVRTGFLRDGGSRLDVKKYVEEAKRAFSAGLVRQVGAVLLNGTNITYRDIGEICFGGRLFNNEDDSDSMLEYFMDAYNAFSLNTERFRPSMNMIPLGMVLKAYTVFNSWFN